MKYCFHAVALIFLSLVFATAIAQTTKKKKPYRYNNSSRYTSSARDSTAVDSNWGYGPFYFIPNIAPEKIGIIGLQCSNPFNEEDALFKVFPGNHYDLHDDERHPNVGEGVSIWRSTKLRSKKTDYDHSFPRKRGNLTEVFKVRPFKDDSGRRNMLVAFQSNNVGSLREMYLGNCKCADMSLALFKLYRDQWVLTNFTLNAGCLGTYQHLPHHIDPIKLGYNNYGCEVRTECYNPGGPGWVMLVLYGLIGNQFKEILNVPSSRYMSMPCNEWGTKIIKHKDSLTFDDIRTVTEGDFCRQMFIGDSKYDTMIDVPGEVYYRTGTADSFGFRITKDYHFDNNKYILKRTRTRYYSIIPRKR
ncbi:MAG: hypothetical protein H7257_10290 [Taibaiella sp.]|nr:hypothetical protein [Taibaiella sp.]